MRVIDCLGGAFASHCNRLAESVIESGFRPTVVIGILTGGAVVSRIMAQRFRDAGIEFAYAETKLQRNSTVRKGRLGVRKYLRRMPRSLCNILRNVEMLLGEIAFYLKRGKSLSPAVLDEQVLSILSDGAQVLVIDDAIDTGSTITAVKQGISERYPRSEVRLAVLTVTHHRPLSWPDYHLYNRVLLRFPWSFDVCEEVECKKR